MICVVVEVCVVFSCELLLKSRGDAAILTKTETGL